MTPSISALASSRWWKPLALGVTALALATLAFELSVVVPKVLNLRGALGVDFHQYQDHTRRWLSGGGFYLPEQLAGPYHVYELVPPLYPPPFVLVILPFLWLPELLWWAIPIAITVTIVAWWRPSPWTWVAIALLAAWPRTYEIILFGNPSMWIAAFAALGTRWAPGFVAVLFKPSLFPLALLRIHQRSWWAAFGLAIAISLPFGAMWIDYAKALLNADQGWTYSLRDVPIVLIPVVAWLGGTRGSGAPSGRSA